jgi:hypothetical protein
MWLGGDLACLCQIFHHFQIRSVQPTMPKASCHCGGIITSCRLRHFTKLKTLDEVVLKLFGDASPR